MGDFAFKLIARVVSGMMSFIQASNLRNDLYQIKEEHELMWTALDDIKRMDKDGKMGEYAKNTLEKIPNRYDFNGR